MQAILTANARCSAIETELGIPHKPLNLNEAKSTARLGELEKLLAAKNSAPIPAASAPAAIAAARPFMSSGYGATTDKAIQASGAHNFRTFKAKLDCDRLEAQAAKYPVGSLSRKAVESNLSKARDEFNKCN